MRRPQGSQTAPIRALASRGTPMHRYGALDPSPQPSKSTNRSCLQVTTYRWRAANAWFSGVAKRRALCSSSLHKRVTFRHVRCNCISRSFAIHNNKIDQPFVRSHLPSGSNVRKVPCMSCHGPNGLCGRGSEPKRSTFPSRSSTCIS